MSSTTVNSKIEIEPIATKVWVKDRTIYIELADFRIIGFPAARFKLLKNATDEQLEQVKIRLEGRALRWEELDEDLTVQGILNADFQLPM